MHFLSALLCSAVDIGLHRKSLTIDIMLHQAKVLFFMCCVGFKKQKKRKEKKKRVLSSSHLFGLALFKGQSRKITIPKL